MTNSSCIINTITIDILATQGTMAQAAMVLTQLSHHNLDSVPQRFDNFHSYRKGIYLLKRTLEIYDVGITMDK